MVENINDLIILKELSLLDKNIRNNKNELENIVSKDFLEYGSSGKIYTYNEIINLLQKEVNQMRYKIINIETKKLSDNIVLLLYTIETEENDIKVMTNRSSIWLKEDEEWKIIFHQGTIKK